MGMEEEDPVDEATISRRERLMALRAAKEFASTPDGDPSQNEPGADAPAVGGGGGEDAQRRNNEVVEEDTIEQAAAARRDRIKALKMAKELLETPDADNGEEPNEAEDESKPNMKFRNYLPHDKQLQDNKLAPATLPKFEDPVAAAPPQPEKVEDPFVNIAPKKPNWDLRRDVQKKLDKLEKRTQKALYQIMQEQEKEREARELEENGVTED